MWFPDDDSQVLGQFSQKSVYYKTHEIVLRLLILTCIILKNVLIVYIQPFEAKFYRHEIMISFPLSYHHIKYDISIKNGMMYLDILYRSKEYRMDKLFPMMSLLGTGFELCLGYLLFSLIQKHLFSTYNFRCPSGPCRLLA